MIPISSQVRVWIATGHTDGLKAALIEARAKLYGAETLIAHLQLQITKMRRELFGPRSERSQRLIEQMELQLEELAAATAEDEVKAPADGVKVQGFTRAKAIRRDFPWHLERQRIVHAAPTACPCCGGPRRSIPWNRRHGTMILLADSLFGVTREESCDECMA